jgi:hypothetical protein
MVPARVAFAESMLLSAQTRMYRVVPASVTGNVCEIEAVAVPPAVSAVARVSVPMLVTLCVPATLLAFWKRFLNPAPVEALTFEMGAERATFVPAVAAVRETSPAVRSGRMGVHAFETALHVPLEHA